MDSPVNIDLAQASRILQEDFQKFGIGHSIDFESDSVDHVVERLATCLLEKPLASKFIANVYRPLLAVIFASMNEKLLLSGSDLSGSRNWEPVTSALRVLGELACVSIDALSFAQDLFGFAIFKSFTAAISENSQTVDHEVKKCHIFALSVYRLLSNDFDRFQSLIDSSVLYKLAAKFRSEHQYIADLSMRILALIDVKSELEAAKWLKANKVHKVEGPYEPDGDLIISYDYFAFLEGKRISEWKEYFENQAISYSLATVMPSRANVANIGGILVPRSPITSVNHAKHFVKTHGALKCISEIATGLKASKPQLIVGPEGSGKTFFIEELAKQFGKSEELVRIHLGDQTDAKILVGTYSTGQKPGSFEWRPGVLTVAVTEGRWVLIEDIDKAPTDIVSVLLPLLDKRELSIPSRGESYKAHRNFRIFATMRSSDNQGRVVELIGRRLWHEIRTEKLEQKDLKNILDARYPLLANMSTRFLATYSAVYDRIHDRELIRLVPANILKVPNTRDLLKWASRVTCLLSNKGIKESDQEIPTEIFDFIFAEAVDCFAGYLPNQKAFEIISKTIGETLEIPSSRVDLFLVKHVPSLTDTPTLLTVGRGEIRKLYSTTNAKKKEKSKFALTNHSLRLLEQLIVSVSMGEPMLLVGETGTGKTTVIQHLANIMGKRLISINLSQQTEISDLIGGYKPVEERMLAAPLKDDFSHLFDITFSTKKNEKFLELLKKCYQKEHWSNVVKLWRQAYKMAKDLLEPSTRDNEMAPKKRRKLDTEACQSLLAQWDAFLDTITLFEAQIKHIDKAFLFSFVEGLLVQAVRRGDWVLLDEINLASADTLECIADLVIENPSITLVEKGDAGSIPAHPEFRLFGAMNPSTDVGKRDLPSGLRSCFTELYVSSPDRDISDLLAIIDKYIGYLALSDQWVGNDVAELYLEAKRLAESNKIVDGANQKPHFSIRTLSRTLTYSASISPIYGLRRSLYEGFCMCFVTLLDKESEAVLQPIISKFTVEKLKNMKSVVSHVPPRPQDGNEYVQFRHYWLRQGQYPSEEQPRYIITPSVEKNLLNLTRATAGRKFPVLIQGPTSSGKTSMINYLAKISGHKFVRINNHEHTDLQEYLGSYTADDQGQLVFKEGALVEAVRNGYWIVLDELNLAPTDVLEALNRLLDDNRELLIPETQEIVKPHPEFMLFATQNPPGVYGGRKMLSRAFRNRFLELHFDDIPENELETILRERCQIAPPYAKKIVDTYRHLMVVRQSSRIFEQKNSFATLRDLFRWAQREAVGYEQLALNGYMLLGERVRNKEEKETVRKALEKVMRVKLNISEEYEKIVPRDVIADNNSVVWTNGMKRLLVLVSQAIANNEPVLLVGETGCGKTTICQVLAEVLGKELFIINAHQNTETGDIIGSQRPVRNRAETQDKAMSLFKEIIEDCSSKSFDDLIAAYESMDKSSLSPSLIANLSKCLDRLKVLFEWSDGSLVRALKSGDFFLLDEISLADDSVLERLNSVLEPERSLFLAEKAADDALVTAKTGFQFFATMNPGGDYGKKELSPALRNRFTEIWVPSMDDFDDVLLIVQSRLDRALNPNLGEVVVKFGKWFAERYGSGNASSGIISLRDILTWVSFINKLSKTMSPELSLFHGACMVFIDSVGSNNSASFASSSKVLLSHRKTCIRKIGELLDLDLETIYFTPQIPVITEHQVQFGSFFLDRNSMVESTSFSMQAPTTSMNALRVVRAMQMNRPILLEGSPGVGKTSLVSALAQLTGNPLTRINLSEQTDLIDLFGADAPVEGKEAGEFVWKDAPFLRAMQKGEWVLLDEMNLASQSVLEGLNACLDHRGEAYIPELDKTFKCHPNFLVFAAQNPQYQGGGRKGLPKSFINRFSVVYVDVLTTEDLELISKLLYPGVSDENIKSLTAFVTQLDNEVSVKHSFGHVGSPFEFNLRDTMRWLSLYTKSYESKGLSRKKAAISDFFHIVISSRFRLETDKLKAKALFEQFFGSFEALPPVHIVGDDFFQVEASLIQRNPYTGAFYRDAVKLQCNVEALSSMVTGIENSWPVILVGPTNSGKTQLIRYIANLYGAHLEEFPMNSDIDSTDLLGGFDQVDANHASIKFWFQVQKLFDTVRRLLLEQGMVEILLSSNFKSLESILKSHKSREVNDLIYMCQLLGNLPAVNENVSHQTKELVLQGSLLAKELQKLHTVKFQWFDGTLIRAIEEGYWLVLDNSNLCNPSVLDRLNSLLEPNGCLMVNECSLENGEPRVVKPHPNFRLFLTVDPKYGELSRAMRNRGIEIFMGDLKARATKADRIILGIEEESRVETEELVSTDIANLEIYPAHPKFPISLYLMWSTASTRFLGLVEDLTVSESGSFLSRALLGITPLQFGNFVANWWKYMNERPGSMSSSARVEYYQALEDEPMTRYGSLIKRSLYGATQETGTFEISADYHLTQPLEPILNFAFSRFLRNITPDEAHLLFSLTFLIKSSTDILKQVEKLSSEAKDVKNATYLEKCFTMYQGVFVKNGPQFNVYILLKSLLQIVSDWLFKAYFAEDSKISSSYSILKYMSELQQVICDIAFLTYSKTDVNESILPVYKHILDDWMCNCPEDLPKGDILLVVEKFVQQVDWQKSANMELVWEKYRGHYPTSLSGWDRVNVLNEIADRFDQICKNLMGDTIEAVSPLRSTIIQALRDSYLMKDVDFIDAVIIKLEAGIIELEKKAQEIRDPRQNYFLSSFSSLGRRLELFGFNKILDGIATQAQISTRHLAKYYLKNGTRLPYPPVLESLLICQDESSIFIVDDVYSRLVSSIKTYNNVESKYYLEATKDLKLLAKYLVKSWPVASAPILPAVKNLVHSLLMDAGIVLSAETVSELEMDFRRAENRDDIGNVCILLALRLIKQFIPDFVYDPAIKEHVIYDRWQDALAKAIQMSKDTRVVSFAVFGRETLLDKILEIPLDEVARPQTYRADGTLINSFFREIWSFIDSYVTNSKVPKLEENDDLRLEDWQINTSRFISRLQERYPYFSDISEVLIGFLLVMKLGVSLKSSGSDNVTDSSDLQILSDPLSLINPSKLTLELCSSKYNSYSNGKLLFAMRALLLNSKFVVADGDTENMILLGFEAICRNLYYKWSLNKLKTEEENASKATIYKGVSEDEAEEEFKMMFPDYEEVIGATLVDKNELGSKDEKASVHDEDSLKVLQMYLRFFSDSEISDNLMSLASESIATSFEDGYPVGVSGSSTLTSIFLNLCQSIRSRLEVNDSSMFNFYHDSSQYETNRIVLLVSRIRDAVIGHLNRWPDHYTLKNIEFSCNELLLYPVTAPVAKFLQKSEQILTFLVEWKTYASREVSLDDLTLELQNLIISWRKLELATWPKVFDFEDLEVTRRLSKWWYYLYENLIFNTSQLKEDEHVDQIEIVKLLSVFLAQATKGDFSTRLQLVRAFSSHSLILSDTLPRMRKLSAAIMNVYQFYEQFELQISEALSTSKRSLIKDLKEIIQLVSWKDTNISALKESFRRSHSKLFKIIRKYRLLVNEPVNDIVDSPARLKDISLTLLTVKTENIIQTPSEDGLRFAQTLHVWQGRIHSLKNIAKTSSIMKGIVSGFADIEGGSIHELAVSAVESAESLKKETPNKITEETKKIISSLKMEKAQLLIAVIKELRESGLKTSVKRHILAEQQSTSLILASTDSVILKKQDSYYYRILEMLPRLRYAVSSGESDVSEADLRRGLMIGENLLHILINKRLALAELEQYLGKLGTLLKASQLLSGNFTLGLPLMQKDQFVSQFGIAHQVIKWAPNVLDYCTSIVESAENLVDDEQGSSFCKKLAEFRSTVGDLNVRLEYFADLKVSENALSDWTEFYLSLQDILNELVKDCSRDGLASTSSIAFDLLSSWLASIDWSMYETKTDTTVNLEAVDKAVDSQVQNLCRSVLVILQEMIRTKEELLSPVDEGWLIKYHNSLLKAQKQLRIGEVVGLVEKLFSVVQEYGKDSTTATKHCLALISTAVPFLTEYLNLAKSIKVLLLNDFVSNSKGSYLLMSCLYSLATEGFCGPQEKQQEQDSNNMKDGTGLGDGSGAQTNNEDVEEDEDLTEHAQGKNDEQDNEDKDEDEDDAVSMDGDMAGDLEDYEDKEGDDDDNDDDDKEEEEDIDEEIGDIDQLDPNQVDEKMWDEQGESNKEKDTEKDVGSTQDDAQGVDDNEDETGEKEDDKEDSPSADKLDDQEGDADESGDEDMDEDDVGAQEDEVQQQENEQLEDNVAENDILDIADDLELDEDQEEENVEDDLNDNIESDNEGQSNDATETDSKQDEILSEGEDNEEKSNAEDEQDEPEETLENDPDTSMTVEDEPEVEPQPEDDHVQGDEPQQDESQQDESKTTKSEQVDVDTEGADDIKMEDEDEKVDTDQATTSKDQSSTKGDGDAETDQQETSDLGQGRSDSKPEDNEEAQREDLDDLESNADNVKESLKQLGNAMEEFYKRHQDIKEASEKDESQEDSANTRPDEFEHLDAEDSKSDAQALGAAESDDINQKIDDDMEIEEETYQDARDDLEEVPNQEESLDQDYEGGADVKSFGPSIVGEKTQPEDELASSGKAKADEMEIEDDEDEELENEYDQEDVDLPSRSLQEASDLWQKYDTATQELALSLAEQLRLILEPTLATKLRGDFKTGKRLNMKRIIPYIASQFKKDKIWLRRTKPAKRDYQIMISLDDSKSMAESKVVDLAFETIAMVSKALTQLEVGQLAVTRFGDTTKLVHPFEKPFSTDSGVDMVRWFGFDENKTDVEKLLRKSLNLFADARRASRSDTWQLQIIISDGICEDHTELRKLVRKAQEEKIIIVFVVVDSVNTDGSILDMNQVQYDVGDDGAMKLNMVRYLDHFPFDYYIIVRDTRELPGVLSSVLRQFFSEIGEQ